MEGRTHFERIIGGTEKEKKVASEELQVAFDTRNEKLAEYELKKTPEDLKILQKVGLLVDKMVLQYGGNPKPLPLDHIYILKPGSVSVMTNGELDGGIQKPLVLQIGVEKGESKLLFASTVAHELFHLKSYKSARVGDSEGDIHLYRSGLSMVDRKDPKEESGEENVYFADLEEAIVAECAKKLLDEISTDNFFREEAEAVRRFKDWVVQYYRNHGASEVTIKEFEEELKYINNPQYRVEQVLASYDDEVNRQAYAAGTFEALEKKGDVEVIERYSERKKLYALLDNLAMNSNGKFKNRNEAFDEFARANFSGNYLPLARTVESILGKGSFRKLAEEFSVEPKKAN